jgi:boron transporter
MPHSQPLRRVRKSRILLVVAVQFVSFGDLRNYVDNPYVTVVLTFWRGWSYYSSLCGHLSQRSWIPIVILLLITPWILVVPRLPLLAEELGIFNSPVAFPFVSRSSLRNSRLTVLCL